MKYYTLEPEVPGGLGNNTIMDVNTFPPRISRLHYVFDGWLSSALVTSFPIYMVTKSLADELNTCSISGFELDDVEVERSEQFMEFYPDRRLPVFRWLKILGRAGRDDFGIAADHTLVVSQRAWDIIKLEGMVFYELTEYLQPEDPSRDKPYRQ